MTADLESAEEAVSALRRSARKMAVFVAVALGAVALSQWPPARAAATDLQAWRARLRAAGGGGPALYFAISAALVAIGAPRLPLAALSGALFGFRIGAPLAWLSGALGSYATFCFARWGGRDWVRRRARLPARAQALLLHPDAFAVALLRQMPVVAIVQNIALAFTDLRHRAFWIGTLAGTLPSTVVVALIGGSVTRESWRGALGYIGAAMALLALLGLTAARWRRRRAAAPSLFRWRENAVRRRFRL